MADFELSCGLPPGPYFADLVELAEELGYARAWIFDSAPLWEDPFAHLALAAERTVRIGLATAVLIPDQRSVMAMASGIATIARISGGRFRACFGTGFTARLAVGQRPMTLNALASYVTGLRQLLAGKTAVVDGQPTRMLHASGLAEPRPVEVPLWVSVFGPRGAALAGEVADGIADRPRRAPRATRATRLRGRPPMTADGGVTSPCGRRPSTAQPAAPPHSDISDITRADLALPLPRTHMNVALYPKEASLINPTTVRPVQRAVS